MSDSANVVVPPPIMFLAALGTGILLHRLRPVPLTRSGTLLGVWSGFALIAASVAIFFFAFRALRRHATPLDPREATTAIVRTGPFGLSRNPLYIALILVFTGIGLIVNSVWMTALVPLLFLTLHFGAVRREEEYLERKFGAEYLDYKRRVRRWL